MKQRKLPIWVLILIDLLSAAACVGIVILAVYILPQGTVAHEQQNELQQQFSLPSASGSAEDTGGLGIKPASKNDWSHRATSTLDASAEEIAAFSDVQKTRETVQQHTGKTSEIVIEKVSCTVEGKPIVYFVADIYVTSTQCVKTAFAKSMYGKNIRDFVSTMALENNALLAISGDSYGESSENCVIRNGTLYNNNASGLSDICVLYADGVMKTYHATEFDAEQAMRDGAWQAWTFGPTLLDGNGNILQSFRTTEYINKVNPRCAIGYIAPGHYKFVLVDGRQDGYSAGVTISELAALMQEEGCMTAYNLDGGKSAVMRYDNTWVNRPIGGGRTISDCIYIAAEE